jgi:hypothetical protein
VQDEGSKIIVHLLDESDNYGKAFDLKDVCIERTDGSERYARSVRHAICESLNSRIINDGAGVNN